MEEDGYTTEEGSLSGDEHAAEGAPIVWATSGKFRMESTAQIA